MKMENVMKKILFAAASAAMVFAVSPSFASIADESENGYAVYPPVSACHFVTERIVTANGHIVYERHQVCN
jgi:hypothetical protein